MKIQTVTTTPRTVTVLAEGRLIKLKKSRQTTTLQGGNRIGEKWGELSRTHRRTVWTCEELGLWRASRLEAETAVWRVAGDDIVGLLQESRKEWHL